MIGIFDLPKGGSPFGVVTVSLATFDRSFATRVNDLTMVNVQGGSSDAASARLKQDLAAYPNVKVETQDEFKKSQLSGLTMMLNMLYLLLGLSVGLWFGLRAAAAPRPAVRAAAALIGIELAQGLIGFVQYFSGLPVVLVAVHMLGATLVWTGTLAMLWSLRTRQPVDVPSPEVRSVASPAGAGGR